MNLKLSVVPIIAIFDKETKNQVYGWWLMCFKIQKSFNPDLLNIFHVDEVKNVKLKKSVLTSKGSIYSDLLTINAV